MSIEVKNEMGRAWKPLRRAWRNSMVVELEKKDFGIVSASLSAEDTLPQYDTQTLFAGKREIVIRHGDADYRMKITKQGKLILNK